MTIKYADGKAVEALLLSRTETTIRAAVEDVDDVMELSSIDGTWVSTVGEVVEIEFAWQRHDRKPKISEAECCCSSELAARLMHLLFADSNENGIEMDAIGNEESGVGGSSSLDRKPSLVVAPRSSTALSRAGSRGVFSIAATS